MTLRPNLGKYNVVRYYASGFTYIIYSNTKDKCIEFMDVMEYNLKTSKRFRLNNTDSNGQIFIHKIEKADQIMTTRKYKKDWYLEHWDVVDSIPTGWKVSNIDSPMPRGVFLTNSKSPLKGGKMKILKLNSDNIDEVRRQQGKRE